MPTGFGHERIQVSTERIVKRKNVLQNDLVRPTVEQCVMGGPDKLIIRFVVIGWVLLEQPMSLTRSNLCAELKDSIYVENFTVSLAQRGVLCQKLSPKG